MAMKLPSTYTLMAITAVLSASTVFAHGDADNPLFVATSGTDTGLCLDATLPCKTIGYALDYAGKGSQIRVASGTYTLSDIEDVFHLASQSVDIRGGYATSDNFAAPSSQNSTTLVGIPQEYSSNMSQRGFNVLADRKGIDAAGHSRTRSLLALQQNMQSSMPAAACTGGKANSLDGAGKLYEQAVAGGICDPTAMLFERWINQFGAVLPLRCERAFLIDAY